MQDIEERKALSLEAKAQSLVLQLFGETLDPFKTSMTFEGSSVTNPMRIIN